MSGDRLAEKLAFIEQMANECVLDLVEEDDVLALVDVAKAARDVADHSWSSLDESMGTMIALRSALARLERA